MKTINANTKRANEFINAYNRATAIELWEVYGTYSPAKARAEIWCREQMYKESGNGYRILSANSFSFTCGWINPEGLRIETASNSYLVKLA